MPKPTQIPKVNRLLENESELLNLALISRTAHKAPSEMIDLADPLTAFEFDAVCTYILENHENKRAHARLTLQLQGIAIILGADPNKFLSEDEEEI